MTGQSTAEATATAVALVHPQAPRPELARMSVRVTHAHGVVLDVEASAASAWLLAELLRPLPTLITDHLEAEEVDRGCT